MDVGPIKDPKNEAQEREFVEEVAVALVREFLNRKGCKRSLQVLDEEIPRGSNSICNRAELAHALHVAPLLRKNKTTEHPFRTIIEIIAWDLVKNKRISNATNQKRSTATGGRRENEIVDGRSPRTRPHSGKNLTAYSPHVNPMVISGLKVKDSVTKYRSEKATAVKAMLSASPGRVISSHDLNSGKNVLNDETDQLPTDDRRSATKLPGTKSSVIVKKKEFLLEDLDDEDDLTEIKCVQWLTGLDKSSLMHNPQLPIEPFTANRKKASGKGHRQAGRKVEFKVTQPGTPLDLETAVKLRRVIFGSSNTNGFSEEWANQTFAFQDCLDERKERLQFGIVQKKGGPCGLLAAVQAHVLKHLLFGKIGNCGEEKRHAEPSSLNVMKEVRTSCLAEALIEILWRAGGERRAVVALVGNQRNFVQQSGHKDDGVTEFVLMNDCPSRESLHQAIYENIDRFENGHGSAILFLYSAILSRGIGNVASDMDNSGCTLMGAHSYCTQEMVNLLTVGVAASNTFDNEMKLDGMVLRGILVRSTVGLLSLFEHYGSCNVGSYLKNPRYPIWIVCSESHFTVLFSLDRTLVDEEPKQSFDLYYYDALANQDEEIRLTVNLCAKIPRRKKNDLVPPLELCIQTKWPNCKIDWNDTEPLL